MRGGLRRGGFGLSLPSLRGSVGVGAVAMLLLEVQPKIFLARFARRFYVFLRNIVKTPQKVPRRASRADFHVDFCEI